MLLKDRNYHNKQTTEVVRFLFSHKMQKNVYILIKSYRDISTLNDPLNLKTHCVRASHTRSYGNIVQFTTVHSLMILCIWSCLPPLGECVLSF